MRIGKLVIRQHNRGSAASGISKASYSISHSQRLIRTGGELRRSNSQHGANRPDFAGILELAELPEGYDTLWDFVRFRVLHDSPELDGGHLGMGDDAVPVQSAFQSSEVEVA